MNPSSQSDPIVNPPSAAGTAAGDLSPERWPFAEEDVLNDWWAAFQMEGADQLTEYGGKFVVVLKGQVKGAGNDPNVLREEWAKKLSVHPERLVIMFVEDTR